MSTVEIWKQTSGGLEANKWAVEAVRISVDNALVTELERFEVALPPDEHAPRAEQRLQPGGHQLPLGAAGAIERNRLRVLPTRAAREGEPHTATP